MYSLHWLHSSLKRITCPIAGCPVSIVIKSNKFFKQKLTQVYGANTFMQLYYAFAHPWNPFWVVTTTKLNGKYIIWNLNEWQSSVVPKVYTQHLDVLSRECVAITTIGKSELHKIILNLVGHVHSKQTTMQMRSDGKCFTIKFQHLCTLITHNEEIFRVQRSSILLGD